MNLENTYYKDSEGETKYNSYCVNCLYKCKQSFRTEIMTCKHIKELKKKGKKRYE